ncbi:MAG: hypothetical protein AAGC55_08210, partial [Myxococcota bacterium]
MSKTSPTPRDRAPSDRDAPCHPRWRPAARVLAGAVPLVLVVAVASCSGERSAPSTGEAERSVTELPEPSTRELAGAGEHQVLDEALMIALAQAKNFHHKADVHLGQGDVTRAVDSVGQILSIPFPDGAPEAEDITLDARARLAKLLAAQGKTEEAMRVVDKGITGASRESFFLANLYTARGEVYEAMANMLDDDDSDDGKERARSARRSAIEAFDRSIA